MFGIKGIGNKLIVIRSDHENPSYSCLPDYRTWMAESYEEAEKEVKRIRAYYKNNKFVMEPQIEVFELTEDQILENTFWGLKIKRS